MTKIASNPILILALGLILGTGSGLAWFWKCAVPLVAAAKLARAKAAEPVKPDAPWDFWTIEMENLAGELRDQREVLKKRGEDLDQREARFVAERKELQKQREQIEAIRDEITARTIEIQADELKNLKTLAETYSNLSPKAALTIFKEMDDTTVVKLLALMKTDVVSPLFEEMSKQAATDPTIAHRAAQLSEKLRFYKATKTASAP